MKELLCTNETVFISWLEVQMRSAGIEVFVLDRHTSVLEGSANAIPRRIMVTDDDYDQARRILTGAGEGWRLD